MICILHNHTYNYNNNVVSTVHVPLWNEDQDQRWRGLFWMYDYKQWVYNLKKVFRISIESDNEIQLAMPQVKQNLMIAATK